MLNALQKTNMTAEEMVPDSDTIGHDPRFWCLPPIHEDLDAVVAIGGGFEFHLVTNRRKVGVWRSWWDVWRSGKHIANLVYTLTLLSRVQGHLRRWSWHPRVRVPPLLSNGAFYVKCGEAVTPRRYFALWGAGLVHSSRHAARWAFDEAVEDGGEPELLTTDDFDVVLSYAEGYFL
ncbi:hypothetical protein C8F04DRAFT_1265296 [Mycena alexandri]|uniref:Uncharacterized protein n=1 Tax=Mycena alexandri TaxID=1745969 RepID=A0AAD6WXP1_9AGAR|nr:hypothetical protein C8F04DRAFT_1265296 [Mycena alexandri]